MEKGLNITAGNKLERNSRKDLEHEFFSVPKRRCSNRTQVRGLGTAGAGHMADLGELVL